MANPDNPIAKGAEEINSIVTLFVQKDLEGIFPKNYVYAHGNYDLVFIVASGHGNQAGGFFKDAEMVVLNPEGEFKSGLVNQYVGNYDSCWRFENAKLELAKPLQVIKYSPRLVACLFSQIEEELETQEDPQKANRVLEALHQRGEILNQVVSISRHALIEMGEEDPSVLIKGEKDYGIQAMEGIKEIIANLPGHSKQERSTAQKEAALGLFSKREELVAEMKSLTENMRVKPVEERFRDIVGEIVGAGIFPELVEYDGESWFAVTNMESTMKAGIWSKMESHHEPYGHWVWGVSKSGLVREIEVYMTIPKIRSCPEHLLEQGGSILHNLINQTVRKQFPKIKI